MRSTVLRGRSSDLADAAAMVSRVRKHRRSGVLLVTGEAGIGKSSLLSAVLADADSYRIGMAKAHESDAGEAGGALFHVLGAGHAPLLTTDELALLIALRDRPLQLLERTSDALAGVAALGPVMIVLDDAQWSDRLSRFVLRSLPGRLAGLPILWALSSRDPNIDVVRDIRTQTAASVAVTHIDLAPLTTADMAAIAQDRLGEVPDVALRDMLARLGGNPFLAVHLLESVAHGATGPTSAARPGLYPPVEFAEGVRRTMASLDPGGADALHLASVLARPFGYHEPRQILGADEPASSARSVDAAVRSGLLLTDNQQIQFRHDLIREAVYANVSPADRERLHRLCATYFLDGQDDAIAAAAHLRAVARVGDRSAAEILLRAADQALAAQPELAGDLALAAFGLLAAAGSRDAQLAQRCLGVLMAVQRFTDVVATADAIMVLGPSAEIGARTEAVAADALFVMGRSPVAAERIDRVLRGTELSAGIRARLQASQALAASRVAAAEAARNLAASALANARDVGERQALVTALTATCEVNKNGGYHSRTLAAARELRITAGASYLSEEIMALQLLDRYDEAQVMLDAAYSDAENHVEAVLPSLVLARMWQDFWLSRWSGAEHAAAELATIGRELGSHVHALEGVSILSVAALQRGDIALARNRFDGMLGYHGVDDEYRGPRMILIRSWIVAAEGDSEQSARMLRPLLHTALESRAHWPWWPGWMRTVVQIGRSVRDRALMDDALAVAEAGAERNPGVVTFEGLALQIRGLVHDDVELLHRAAGLLATGPRELLAATCEKDLGHALIARGETVDGIQRLRRALDSYSRLSMPMAMSAVSRTLARHGGSVQDDGLGSTFDAWARLTVSEERVARLISMGYTNRAVADELQLSPNTIGSHARTAFAKLGVQSRVQLSNAVRGLAEAGLIDVES